MRLTWAVAGIIVSRWRIRGTFPSVSVYIYLDLIQGMHWCVWAWMADRVVVYFYSQSKAWTSLQMTACNWGLGGSQIKEFDSACATTLCCTITIRSVPEWVKFGVVLKLGSVFNQVWKHKNVKTLPELLNIVLIVVIFKKSKKKKNMVQMNGTMLWWQQWQAAKWTKCLDPKLCFFCNHLYCHKDKEFNVTLKKNKRWKSGKCTTWLLSVSQKQTRKSC